MPISDLTGTTWIINTSYGGTWDQMGTYSINYKFGGIGYGNTEVTITSFSLTGMGPQDEDPYMVDIEGTCAELNGKGNITPSDYASTIYGYGIDPDTGLYQGNYVYLAYQSSDPPWGSGWTLSNHTMTILGGTDATNSNLIAWLEANAVQQEGPTYNKVEFDGYTIIDLSQDTVIQGGVLSGQTYHDSNGASKTGIMSNRGAGGGYITTKAGSVTIPTGYYNGTGSVAISSTEQAKIIAGNIKSGVTILGVTGSYSGGATPSYTVTSATVNDVAEGQSFYAADSTTTVTRKTGNLLDWRSSTNTLSTWDGAYLSNISYVSNGLKVVPPCNMIISGQYDTVGGDSGPNNGVYIDNTSLRMAIGLMSNPGDTSASSKIVSGYTIAGVTGTGGGSTPSYVTTSRASASEVLSGKYFYYPSSTSTVTRTQGTMTNRGAVSQTLTASSPSYTIPSGYHNGSGVVSVAVYDGSVVTA